MLMRGHNLFGHLDGSIPTHSKIISENNVEVSNPEFVSWFQQDQLIQNAILATVDATIGSTVTSATNAKVAWDALHTAYANKSQTRIFSLRDRLARVSKDSRPDADYLHQVRSLCDELATAGSPVSNEELIVKILAGLGFRELSAAIRARDSTIPYEELYEKLLDHELFLQHEDAKKTPSVPITANIAKGTTSSPTRQGSTNHQNNNQRSNVPNQQNNYQSCNLSIIINNSFPTTTSTANSVIVEAILLVYVGLSLIIIFKRVLIMLQASKISQLYGSLIVVQPTRWPRHTESSHYAKLPWFE